MITEKIEALLAYLKETTGVEIANLGEAVRALYQGGQGRGSSPSLAPPPGELSAKVAALLAYANESTGSREQSLGEALSKTLNPR